MNTRNAIILILCIALCALAAGPFKKGTLLGMGLPAREDIPDAVRPPRRDAPRLTLAGGQSEDLRDAVAGSLVPRGQSDPPGVKSEGRREDLPGPAAANAPADAGGPPRGGGYGGFAPLPNNPRPVISPSGPTPPSE